MEVKYNGVYPEVKFKERIFKRGDWATVPDDWDMPFDFIVKGAKPKKNPMDELRKIRGIGAETLRDIKRKYRSIEELRRDLSDDKAPFRNDIVKKLKKHLEVV